MKKPQAHVIELQQDVQVTFSDQTIKKYAAGEKIEINKDPILVESPGYISTVIFPPQENSAKYSVQLKPISQMGGLAYKKHINESITPIMEEVLQVQQSIAEKKYPLALTQTQELRKKFPYVEYLKLLEVSCLLLNGEKEKSQALLKEALKNSPENAAAKKLYRYLAGEES